MRLEASLFAIVLGLNVGSVVEAEETRSLTAIIAGLRAIAADDETSYGYIPEDGRRLLLEFKRQVGQTIIEAVTSSRSMDDPSQIRALVLRALENRRVSIGEPPYDPDTLGYGYVSALDVAALPGHMLAVMVSFSLACGHDSDLYVFRLEREVWLKVLSQVSLNYGDISAGQQGLVYRVSGRSRDDASLLVMTAFFQPWCSSVWRPLRYSIYRVIPSRREAKLLLSGTTDAVAIDEDYSLESDAAGFTLKYKVSGETDAGLDRVRKFPNSG